MEPMKTTTKTTTKSSRPRITKREKRIMEAWRDQANTTDAAFFQDEQVIKSALQYFSLEELWVMKDALPLPSLYGTQIFDAEALPVVARAIRRRDELLKPLIENLEANLPWLVESYMLNEVDFKTIMRRVRNRIDEYDGPPDLACFYQWAIPEVAATIKALNIVRKVEAENRIAFADVYQRAYRAVWAGVLEILKGCCHLGATHEVAEELVQITLTKILFDIESWYDDGDASLATRVRAYAESQALGWRTERIREKQRQGRLLGGVRRRLREMGYAKSAKKPSADLQNEL